MKSTVLANELLFAWELIFMRLQWSLGCKERAERRNIQLLKKWPMRQEQILSHFGDLHMIDKTSEEAITVYRKSIELSKDNDVLAFTYASLGQVYEKSDDKKNAIDCYEKALRIGVDFTEDFRNEIETRLHVLGAR